jgi:hypothetical protein
VEQAGNRSKISQAILGSEYQYQGTALLRFVQVAESMIWSDHEDLKSPAGLARRRAARRSPNILLWPDHFAGY